MKKFFHGLFIGLMSFLFFATVAHALTVLPANQGGTGIGSTTSSNIGKALIVSSTSPFLYTFGDAGQGGSTSSPFIPCAYWATSTPVSLTGSLCLYGFEPLYNPQLGTNGSLDLWDDIHTPTDFVTTTFFAGDPADASGSGSITETSTPCEDGNCAQVDVNSPTSAGAVSGQNPYIVSFAQPFTYDQTKSYNATFDVKMAANDVGATNFVGIVFTAGVPLSLAAISDPTTVYWQQDDSGWTTSQANFLCIFLPNDTSWHTFSVQDGVDAGGSTSCLLPTGNAGTSTVYVNFVTLASPIDTMTSYHSTFLWDNLLYGVPSDASTPGFTLTTPTSSIPFRFNGGAAAHFESLSTVAEPMTNITTTLRGTPTGDLLPGGQLVWDAYKMALFAGGVSSDTPSYGLDTHRGIGSANFGLANQALGIGSFVGGAQNQANGDFSFCVGNDNHCNGLYSNAFGIQLTNNGTGSSAFGFNNTVGGTAAAVFGNNISGMGDDSITGGLNVTSTGKVDFAFGQNLTVTGDNSIGFNLGSTPATISQNNTFAIMGGSVGIGTTTPDANLEIRSTVNGMAQQHFVGPDSTNAKAGGYVISQNDANLENSAGAYYSGSAGQWIAQSTVASIWGMDNANIGFYINSGLTPGNSYSPTQVMEIDPTGRVGINTTTPSARLTVMGGNVAPIFSAYTTTTLAETILANGNIGVRTTTPGKAFDVIGEIRSSATSTASCFSTDGINCGPSTSNNNTWTGTNTFATTTFNGQMNLNFGTPSTTACGTAPSLVGSNQAGTVTIGTGISVTACTITFSPSFTATPHCTITGLNTFAGLDLTAQSASSITVGTSVSLAGGQFNYTCLSD